MTRILITGATGFFGWNAVRHFTGRGYDVVAGFHTLPHYLHNVVGCQPVALDVADGAAIEKVVNRFQPDLILHAAALARPQIDSDAESVRRVNVHGTQQLAVAATSYNIPLIYISTDLVYPSDAGVCNEQTAVRPTSANNYAASKLEGEERVRQAGGEWIILRSALMYGAGSPRSGGFSGFLDRTWDRGEPAPLFTDQFRSFLYAGDLCRAIEQVGLLSPTWNELYVCGGEERLSRAEFGLRYADARGVDRSMCRLMTASELEGYVGGASDITLDSTKLRSTGWQPRPMQESFSEMEHYRVAVT